MSSKDKWTNKERPNAYTRIPYAYKVSPDDPLILIPDWDVVEKVEQALDALDYGATLRESAEWLTEQTGKSLSHQGLSQIWKRLRADSKESARKNSIATKKRKKRAKTGQEKLQEKLHRKIGQAKRSQTIADKKLTKLEQDMGLRQSNDLAQTSLYGQEDETEQEVIFRPNFGPQETFLASSEQEILYGGAAGGGKSYALLADPLRYFHKPQMRGLLLRRTTDELRELIWKSQELYGKAFPKAKWNQQDKEWRFPSGARLWMSYLERDEDVLRYQGQSFTWIGFDELTQYATPFAWNYLRSRLRSTDPEIPLSQRGTTNPGGIGHTWVKKMFIDPAPANTAFIATDIDTEKPMVHPALYQKPHPLAGQPNPLAGQPLFYRRFIPASLYDNPYLTQDGNYESSLLSLPEDQRRKLLEGDWTVAEGAAFKEFRSHIHIIEPFEIDPSWLRFRSCDYGYNAPSCVLWYAVDPAYGTLYVYRELYEAGLDGHDLSIKVLEMQRGENISYGVLDSSAWHERGQRGPSIAEEMINAGSSWRPADRSKGSRVAGKNRIHALLKVDPFTNLPGIRFFNTCRHIISDLPTIPVDPKGGEDIDVRYATDHSYDSLRYGVQSRPTSQMTLFNGPSNGEFSPTGYAPSDNTFGY